MPDSQPITKPFFEAGMQCAKRLYLDFHEPGAAPAPSAYQQELVDLGRRLVQLASQAFPKGTDLGELDIDEAIERTRELVEGGLPGVMFHAAFCGGGAKVRTDVVLLAGKGQMDIFEIKAGTSVKPRHLTDVAMQVHAIEASGYEVKSCSLLHLDPRYVHDGTQDYPVQKLFKSVDVTSRARNQAKRVEDRIASFQPVLEDEGTLDLPTGTWCRQPLPCPYLARCIEQAPANPLVELPQLTPGQERRLHERAVESIPQLEPDLAGLTSVQRRVVRAIRDGGAIVEPFVSGELDDVDWPLAFVHVGWHLDALPRVPASRPWQKAPYLWSSHRMEKSGRVYCRNFVSANPDDPRPGALKSLAEELADIGTVFVFGRGHDERLRALLEDLTELKTELRSLLNNSLLELGNLIFHGVYHADFHGNFELPTTYRVLRDELGDRATEEIEGLVDPGELEIADDAAAATAYRKIIAKRTRATTRTKLGGQLEAYAKHSSASLLHLYRMLRD